MIHGVSPSSQRDGEQLVIGCRVCDYLLAAADATFPYAQSVRPYMCSRWKNNHLKIVIPGKLKVKYYLTQVVCVEFIKLFFSLPQWACEAAPTL